MSNRNPGDFQEKPILVLGGTGKTGRRIAARLEEKGIPTRIGSRSGRPPFDWNDTESWAPVLEGIGAAYIAYYPDLAVPGAAYSVRAFAQLAKESGVHKLVLLSGRGEAEAQLAEKFIREAGVDWTVLRASWFAQNFSENFLADEILRGEVVLPVGDVGEPFVDAEDIADVAVAALTEAGHSNELYELTGPRLLTFEQAVGEIAAAAGRTVRYREVGGADYAAFLRQADLPADYIDLVMYLFTTVMDGRNACVADGVERALGRRPRDFADYALAAAGTGVWEARQ